MPRFAARARCSPPFAWRSRFGADKWLLLIFLLTSLSSSLAEDNPPPTARYPADTAEAYASPTSQLGSWIWTQKTFDDQTCELWHTITIPENAKVAKARLVMTTDNEFTLYLDGQKLGRGAEWRELFVFDLTQLLTPGKHVLAVDCYNGSFYAGMLFGLRVDLADGRTIEVKSDPSWKVIPDGTSGWKKRTEAEPGWLAATVIAPLGGNPWWTQPAAVIMMPLVQPTRVYFWQTAWFQISLLSLCVLVILASIWLFTQLAFHRKEIRLLQRERARIARDIHDDIGARMTQLVVHGEVTQNGLPADSELRPQLSWICEETRGLLSAMDEILWAVNPQQDTLRDFANYVCEYAQEFLKPTRIQCFFTFDPELPALALNLPLRRSLLMSIKETLNNAVKHSAATELHLQIRWQDPRLIIEVRDNGQGFDLKAANLRRTGNGLINMSQRLRELGGSCHLSSQPGQGCRIEFTVPLKRPFRPIWWRLFPAKPLLEIKP